jgi:propionate CoA-transferase
MRLDETIRLAARIAHWRMTWAKRDLDHLPVGYLNTRIRTARDVAELVPDGACCISTGMAGNARCSTLFWAIRERFQREGRPRGLTWIAVGGQGGRGRAPGTVEEVALEGLLARFITGHTETAKAQLKLAEAGKLEVHVMAQGEMCLALEAQADGDDSVLSRTGLDTALDPDCGRGSALTPNPSETFITREGDRLRYRLPRIDVAVIAAPWADRDGNVYFDGAATRTEALEAARAARANGGRVLVSVAGLVDSAPDRVVLPAAMVDAIAVNPRQEQTVMVPQHRAWPMFSVGGDGDDHAAIEKLRFINRLLRLTPVRGPAELATARLAAHVFARELDGPATVNIGVGLGEEVCRELYESGLHDEIRFTTETGVYGGLPGPGVYFGAAVNPARMESSAWMFRHYADHLDACVLGFLQIDGAGNVNASKRGPRLIDQVGAGGLPSIVRAARTCIFIGTFMQGAKWRLADGALQLIEPGRPKLVEAVDEISVNGARELADGKRLWYVTTVGAFRLTESGLVLEWVMPGIDVERDVRPHCEAGFAVPPGGPRVAPRAVLGAGCCDLRWGVGLASRGPIGPAAA